MKNKDRILNIISLAIIAVYSAVLLYFSRFSYIWYDESFTMNLVNHPVKDMIGLTALDVHPPLYYLVVKLFVSVLGPRTIAYHLPSLLFVIAILLETLLFLNKYADSKTALFSMIGFICVPQIAKYALEIRMYSMCMFLIASSVFLIFSMLKDFEEKEKVYFNAKWVLLAILQTACAYTHYFGGVAAVGSSLAFLIFMLIKVKKPGRTFVFWFSYCFSMLIMYIPWIKVLFSQMSSVNEDYWIGPPSLSEMKSYFDEIFKTDSLILTVILVILFVLGIILSAVFAKKEELSLFAGISYITVGFWLLFGFGYSILVSPIIVSRYLVMLLPILWLPALAAIVKNSHVAVTALMILVMIFIGFKNTKPVLDEYKNSEQMYLRAYLDEHLDKENDAFFSFYMQDMSIQAAYYPGVTQYLLEGRDAGEAFKSWPLLVNCRFITDFNELHEAPGVIWCQDGMFPGAFTDAGYSLEEVPVGNGILYRYYMD